MSDDELWLEPPDAQQVARRALILSAVVCRGSIDGGAGDEHAEKLPGRIKPWLEGAALTDHLEPWEGRIMRAALGQLPSQCISDATWAVEGLAVLAWALGRSELPEHDASVDPFAVTDAVGFLADDASDFIATAELRSPDELNDYRELMYAIHCRLRGFLRREEANDFSAWVEQAWLDRLRLARGHLIVDHDLSISGKPIAAAAPGDVRRCERVINERHRTSIWLVGEEHPFYWDWSVDT
jgi:hypothetical protein